MVVLIPAGNKLLVQAMKTRQEYLQDGFNKPKDFRIFVEDYGDEVMLELKKGSPMAQLSIKPSQWDQLCQKDVESVLSSKINDKITFGGNDYALTIEFNILEANDEKLEEYSKLRIFCLLSKLIGVIRADPKSNESQSLLILDNINSLFFYKNESNTFVIYAINTALALEDQTLMDTFLTQFSSQKYQGLLTVSYSKTRPERFDKFSGTKNIKATYYVTFSFRSDELKKNQKCLDQIINFPHSLHLHMKSAKNCINLATSIFIKSWTKLYNRAIDDLSSI